GYRCRSRKLENAVHIIGWYPQTVTQLSSLPYAAACNIDRGGGRALAAARLEVRQEVRKKADRRQKSAQFEHKADARRVREQSKSCGADAAQANRKPEEESRDGTDPGRHQFLAINDGRR